MISLFHPFLSYSIFLLNWIFLNNSIITLILIVELEGEIAECPRFLDPLPHELISCCFFFLPFLNISQRLFSTFPTFENFATGLLQMFQNFMSVPRIRCPSRKFGSFFKSLDEHQYVNWNRRKWEPPSKGGCMDKLYLCVWIFFVFSWKMNLEKLISVIKKKPTIYDYRTTCTKFKNFRFFTAT